MGNQLRQVSFSSLAVVIGFGGNLFTKDSYGYGMGCGIIGGNPGEIIFGRILQSRGFVCLDAELGNVLKQSFYVIVGVLSISTASARCQTPYKTNAQDER